MDYTPGPPVFGAATRTASVGASSPASDQVACPDGSVLTGVRAGLNANHLTIAAGALCSAVTVTNGSVALAGQKDLAGYLAGADPTYDVGDAGCTPGQLVTSFRGAETGSYVDGLALSCRRLFADGAIGAAPREGGQRGRFDFSETTRVRGPYECPTGAVATGIYGSADPLETEEQLFSFGLICRPLSFPTVTPSEYNLSWPTALTVGANSSTDGGILTSGEERWYRFPVQPGSRVGVDLSNLPADYDLTLFTDIDQAFGSLTSVEDLTKLSAEFAGDAFAQSVFSPSVFAQSVFSPSVFSQSVFSPSVFSQSVFSPAAFSQSVFSPSVFSPAVFTASAFAQSVFSPATSIQSVFSQSVFSPSVFTQSVFSDAFSSAQTRSLIGISARAGTAAESLSSATWNNTGHFYVRVHGRNGASSPSRYTLTVTSTPGLCAAPLETFASTPTLTGSPGSAQTVILTDPARMPGTAADKSALASALTTFAGRVGGTVVDLGQSQRVQALQRQADSSALIACPYAKNLAAQAARDIVNSYRDSSDTLKYVVVVGDDSVVPFFRYPDSAGLGPESNYIPPVADDTASEASLRGNYVLGQDAYGAATDLSIKGTVMPLPDVAVGRLVESPTDITSTLQRFVARNGAPLTPTSSLTTGYDFLTDAADKVAGDFSAGVPGGRHDTLITGADVPPSQTTQGSTPSRRTSWTATDLRRSLFGSRHDLVFLAGHFSANNTLAADYTTTVNSTEVASAPANTFADSLILSAGCHSGYTIVDRDGVPNVTVGLDWSEALARQGATLIGGTGYQYGDTDFLEYSERLYADVAHELRIGTGAVPIGRALLEAKQNYLSGTPTLQGIDQKSILEATLYGLPMLGVNLPAAGRLADPSDTSTVSATAVSTGPGAQLNLRSADVTLNTASLGTVQRTLTNLDGGTVTATYLTGPDGVSVNPAEPALPLVNRNVTVPGQVLRGVAMRSATYTDTNGITPLTGAPATETHGVHHPFVTSAFFPGRFATPNYFDALTSGGATRLLVTPAQYRSDGPGSLTSTQRRFSSLGLKLFYSANTARYGDNVPAQAAPPSITDVQAAVAGRVLTFSARVVGHPAAGLQQVFLTYTGQPGSPFHGSWTSLDLTQDPNDSTRWTASLTLPSDQAAADVRYQVQAVNGVGLVGVDDNHGSYFTPGIDPGQVGTGLAATTLRLTAPVPNGGDYADTVTVRATLTRTAGGALGQRAVTFAVGGSTRTVFTDGAGLATAALPLSVVTGTYALVASYEGDDATAASSTAPSPFTVTKQPTTLTLAVTSATATAKLLDKAGLPLREKTVYFAYANAAGTVLAGRTLSTGFAGTAEFPLTDRPTGATQVRVYFGVGATPLPGGATQSFSDPSYSPAGPVSAACPVRHRWLEPTRTPPRRARRSRSRRPACWATTPAPPRQAWRPLRRRPAEPRAGRVIQLRPAA